MNPINSEGYGTTYRETMMKVMRDPAGFKPLNRREDTYCEILGFWSRLAAIGAGVCLTVEFAYQIALRIYAH